MTEGVGLAQRRGGPIEEIHPGDRVFFEPGEDHWHGATPNRFMTHLAIVEVDDEGNPAVWGDHVTDAEYNAAAGVLDLAVCLPAARHEVIGAGVGTVALIAGSSPPMSSRNGGYESVISVA